MGKLFPVDEAVTQPDFFTFRANLLRTVQTRDTVSLYAVLAPNVLNSFGGDGGVAEFKTTWRPAADDTRLWEILTSILALGGSFHGDTMFTAPYTFSRFPSDVDPFEHVVVVGANVRVRAAPAATAPVVTIASFDILPIARDAANDDLRDEWAAVELNDGRTGYVHTDYARSPIGYRATFIHRGGVWLLRSLVAGD